MAIIAPSILSADFANLERDIQEMERNGADWVHVDVMDGTFVPNITLGMPAVRSLRKVTKMPLDVHLMINKPSQYVEEFVKAGADWLSFHIEAEPLETNLESLRRIRELGCKAAIALRPATPAEDVIPYLELCDMILVMTVEPGMGGQGFRMETMPKLKKLRQMLDEVNPGCILEVDGGINTVTQQIVKENGAYALVAGSAYFKAPDRGAFVRIAQE